MGNFWSNYTGLDADEDGIGDTTFYITPKDVDNYPLMKATSIAFQPDPTVAPTPTPKQSFIDPDMPGFEPIEPSPEPVTSPTRSPQPLQTPSTSLTPTPSPSPTLQSTLEASPTRTHQPTTTPSPTQTTTPSINWVLYVATLVIIGLGAVAVVYFKTRKS